MSRIYLLLFIFWICVGPLQSLGQTAFTVTTNAANGTGSLEEAMTLANQTPGSDTIKFNIPAALGNTIAPFNLPDIIESVYIDGFSQPVGDPVTIQNVQAMRIFASPGSQTYIFKHLTFENGDADGDGAAIEYTSSVTGDVIEIDSCTFLNNTATFRGGAVYLNGSITARINRSLFRGNSALDGGALYLQGDGSFSISGCIFENNDSYDTSSGSGGAISTGTGTHDITIIDSYFWSNISNGGPGGAINFDGGGTGNVVISRALFAENQAQDGSALNLGQGSYKIDNATFSGNLTYFSRGAIYSSQFAVPISLTSVTLYNNLSSGQQQFKDITLDAGDLTMSHTITENLEWVDGEATVTSDGHNFVAVDTLPGRPFPALTTDITGMSGYIDPQLGPLQRNGAPSPKNFSHAPYPGSPLIDKGSATDLAGFTADQRGLARVLGTEADIGAIEYFAIDLPKIYWTDNGGQPEINRANPDGTGFEQWAQAISSLPKGVAIDTTTSRIYWTDGSLTEVYGADITDLGPTNISTLYSTGGDGEFNDIELDLINGKIYWADLQNSRISRMNLDGSGLEADYITAVTNPRGLAIDVDNDRIFWSENVFFSVPEPSLHTAVLSDGSGKTLIFNGATAGDSGFEYIDVEYDGTSDRLFWTVGDFNSGFLSYADVSSLQTSRLSFSTTGSPSGFELDLVRNKIYYIDQGDFSGLPRRIVSAELDGSNAVDLLVGSQDGLLFPEYIAVDFGTIINPNVPIITLVGPSVICSGDSTLMQSTPADSYQWYLDGSPIAGATSQAFYAQSAGAYNVEVNIGAEVNFAASDVSITVESLPTISVQPISQTVCDGNSTSLSITSSDIGATFQWEVNDGSGYTQITDNVIYSGSTSGTLSITDVTGLDGYTYRSTVTGSGSLACQRTSSDATLTLIFAPQVIQQSANVPIGSAVNIDLLAGSQSGASDTLTVTITDQPIKGTVSAPVNGMVTYTPSAGTVGADSIGFEVCNQCGLCDSSIAVIDILNGPPVITPPPFDTPPGQQISIDFTPLITDPNNNIDSTSLRIVSGPLSDAIAFFDRFVLVVDYSNSSFTGEDLITIEVCDLSGECVQSEITITVGIEDIIVINAISPNGDGRHEFLEIENIQFYEGNIVKIYNRWGEVVFETTNYNNTSNVFTGGNLNSGTYFYTIDLNDGSKPRSGNLLLKN